VLRRQDVDARHNGMCSGRRSRTRVPGMTELVARPAEHRQMIVDAVGAPETMS
jgi:hypothetical protein